MKLSSLSLEWLVAGRDDLDMHPKKFLVKSQTWYTQCSVWGTGFVWGGGYLNYLDWKEWKDVLSIVFLHSYPQQIQELDLTVGPWRMEIWVSPTNGDVKKMWGVEQVITTFFFKAQLVV